VFSYLIETTTRVTKDNDTVEDFFGKMEEFLTRLSILKDNVPKEAVLEQHLVKILESFLTLCGIATKYIDRGRFSMVFKQVCHIRKQLIDTHRALPFKPALRRRRQKVGWSLP
jgi:hypothetical protein